jgi:hypothetical protein
MGPETRAFLAARMTPERRAFIDAFLASEPEHIPDPIDPSQCTREHPRIAGPNMDIGQCELCWMPMGVMRPEGETFGWHSSDCSLPMRHPGNCAPGGAGHVAPDGHKFRG